MSEIIKIKIKEIKAGKQLDSQYGKYQQLWVISDKDVWYSANAVPSIAEDMTEAHTWKVGQEITVECKTSESNGKTYRNIKALKQKEKALVESIQKQVIGSTDNSEILNQLKIINTKLDTLLDKCMDSGIGEIENDFIRR